MNICFIGFGHLAKAIAQRLLHHKSYHIWAASPSLPAGTNQEGIITHHDNLAILPQADILILAVKPLQMPMVMQEISASIPKNCLIISVAAGLSLQWFAHFVPSYALIRAMPNIAASIGESATPLTANALTSKHQKQAAEQLFNHLGITTWVTKEAEMDYFTALSGSGPAYVFLFMEEMIKTAVHLGMSEKVAKLFTLQTFRGAIHLASHSNLEIDALRKTVTSPAGTTAAAIDVFKNGDFGQLVNKAICAAWERAKALAQ